MSTMRRGHTRRDPRTGRPVTIRPHTVDTGPAAPIVATNGLDLTGMTAADPFSGAEQVGLPTPELSRNGDRIRIDYDDQAAAFIDVQAAHGTLGVRTDSTLGPAEAIDLSSRIDIAASEVMARYGETHGADGPADLIDNTILDRTAVTNGHTTRVEFGDTTTAQIVVEHPHGTVGVRIDAAMAPNEAQMFARILAARSASLSVPEGRPVQPARNR